MFQSFRQRIQNTDTEHHSSLRSCLILFFTPSSPLPLLHPLSPCPYLFDPPSPCVPSHLSIRSISCLTWGIIDLSGLAIRMLIFPLSSVDHLSSANCPSPCGGLLCPSPHFRVHEILPGVSLFSSHAFCDSHCQFLFATTLLCPCCYLSHWHL